MLTENTVKPPRRWNNGGVVMCLLLLMIGASPEAQAQESPTSSQDTQIRRKAELHTRAEGKIIAEGRNTNASEQVPVNRYTVEELTLDEPLEAEIDGKKTEVYQAYRITVFGGPFHLRAMALLLKIDDKTTLVGVEGPKLDKVTFILYDRSQLREGATLAIGYGAVGIELTDKLSLGETRK
jgi:hypothetical protein